AQRLDLGRVLVHTAHLVTEIGKARPRYQTDIAGTDHHYPHAGSPSPRSFRCAPSSRTLAGLATRSAAAAIGRDTLIGQPQPLRRRAALPEDIDRNASARVPVAANPQPARPHFLEQALADADGDVLVEAAVITERGEEQLEALALDDGLAGGVVDYHVGEIGL